MKIKIRSLFVFILVFSFLFQSVPEKVLGASSASFVQVVTQTGQTNASQSLSLSNISQGDLLVLAVVSTSADVSTIIDANHTWQLAATTRSAAGYYTKLYYTYNTVAGSASPTVNFTGSTYNDLYLTEYTGIQASSNPLDTAVSGSGASSPFSVGPVATHSSNEMIIAFGEYDNGSNVGAGSGFTLRSSADSNVFEDKYVASAGSYIAGFIGGTPGYAAVMATFIEGNTPTPSPTPTPTPTPVPTPTPSPTPIPTPVPVPTPVPTPTPVPSPIPGGGNGSPLLAFTDLAIAQNIGNTDTSLGQVSGQDGAIVTVWGKYLGTNQGTSQILIGGIPARVYTWGNATAPADLSSKLNMQMVAFQIPHTVPAGATTIQIVVNGVGSNTLPFIVRTTGNIYYVKTTGDDVNGTGSWTSPWKKPSLAVYHLAPNDILYLTNGVQQTASEGDRAAMYLGEWGMAQNLVSSKAGPKAIIGYPGADALIGNSVDADAFSIYAGGASTNYNLSSMYWVISKLRLTAVEGPGNLGSGFRFIGNKVTAPLGGGATGAISASGNDIYVMGNEVTQVGAAGTSKLYHPIYIQSAESSSGPRLPLESNREIAWNYMHNNYAYDGINIYREGASSAYQTDNRIHDNYIINQTGRGMLIGQFISGENSVYNNIIIHAGSGPAPSSVSDPAFGYVCVAFQAGANGNPATTIHFYNNSLYGCGFTSGIPNTAASVSIYHYFPFQLDFRNNIIQSTGGFAYVTGDSDIDSQTTGSKNVWYGNGVAPSWDSSPVTGDPKYVASGSGDLHLQVGSSAIDTGATGVSGKPSATVDFDNVSRPIGSGIDIGAYEYNSGGVTSTPIPTPTPPPVDTTAPTVPTGLSATTLSTSGINILWTPSTDNVGVTGYKVFRNGVQIATPSTNSYSDTGLMSGTLYSYKVSAYDAVGNNSSQSTIVSAITQTAPDTTIPLVSLVTPTNGSTVSGTIILSATASDPVVSGAITSGVVGVIFKIDGKVITTDLSYPYAYTLDTTTLSNGSHTLTVIATDGAGNLSSLSTTVITVSNITTLPVTPTLTVILSATPNAGTVPVNGVSLTATLSGTAIGNSNFYFYCNRNDTTTSTSTVADQKSFVDNATVKLVSSLCSYMTPGTYIAKVIVERNGLVSESRANVTVSAVTSTPAPTPTPSPVSGGGGGGGGGGGIITPVIPPVTNLVLTALDGQIFLTWVNPSDTSFVRTVVVRKIGSAPISPTDGTTIYEGVTNSFVDRSLTNNQTYYYAVFPVLLSGTVSSPSQTVSIKPEEGVTQSHTSGTDTRDASSDKKQLLVTLYRGVNSSDVSLLQAFLTAKGYLPPGNISGFFGPLTEVSVQHFQKNNNIVVSGDAATTGYGVVGLRTRLVLNTQLEGISLTLPNGTAITQNTSGNSATNSTFTRNLSVGLIGSDVKLLQQFLNSHGFIISISGVGSSGQETTYFGRATMKALKKFQQNRGIIPASGFFGPITRENIK